VSRRRTGRRNALATIRPAAAPDDSRRFAEEQAKRGIRANRAHTVVALHDYRMERSPLTLGMILQMMRRVHLSDEDLEITDEACRGLVNRYRRDAESHKTCDRRPMIARAERPKRMADRRTRSEQWAAICRAVEGAAWVTVELYLTEGMPFP
jgi:hypothetical protein